jgi:hypothetical protein
MSAEILLINAGLTVPAVIPTLTAFAGKVATSLSAGPPYLSNLVKGQ